MIFIEFNGPKIIERLSQLEPNTTPNWGTMTPVQMVDHLSTVLKTSIGKLQFDLVTPEKHLPKAKAFLMSEKPMPRDFKAAYLDSQPSSSEELKVAIDQFKNILDDFSERYSANKNLTNLHPIFGDLNHEEWIWMHRKHITHHFEQFGLV